MFSIHLSFYHFLNKYFEQDFEVKLTWKWSITINWLEYILKISRPTSHIVSFGPIYHQKPTKFRRFVTLYTILDITCCCFIVTKKINLIDGWKCHLVQCSSIFKMRTDKKLMIILIHFSLQELSHASIFNSEGSTALPWLLTTSVLRICPERVQGGLEG